MNSAPAAVPATWVLFAEMADFAKLTISSQNLRKGGKHLQSKHNKSRSLKSKIIASAIAAVLVASSAVPAITTGLGSANAASVDDEATGATDVTTIGNTQDNIVWTNATYFDYLTDDEKSGGYLTGIKKYGTGFNGSIDEWYPYYGFNNKIKDIANRNSAWSKPLYFGNFCNTLGAYNTSPHHVGSGWHSGYDEAVAQTTRFDYAANNSNGLSNMYQSYQGLMQSTLDANGNLMATSTLKAPYFDEAQLGDYAKVFKSRFPFRSYEENGVTKYEFDSTGAKDNVYFTWSGTTPTKVNYGAGTSYGVKDGIDYFMNPADGQSSGYGIFPFNNRSAVNVPSNEIWIKSSYGTVAFYAWNNSGNNGGPIALSKNSSGYFVINQSMIGSYSNFIITSQAGGWSNQTGNLNISDYKGGAYNYSAGVVSKLNTSENLDFGFGIKTEMNFRVPKGGVDKAGNDIKFTYSGDDDLWVYITDTTTNTSQLVLDLGGNHKQATGEINFKTMKATANDVYGRGKVTTDFTYDYSKTYKMSIFYMERGMLESNCKMTFTMVPLGNNVIVTEKIDTTYVNAGIKDAVTAASKFGFDVYDGSTVKSSFDLGNGDTATETKCTTGNNVHVVQTHPDTGLKYTTSYDIYNTANKSGTIRSGTTTTSPDIRLINPSDDTYDFAEVEADFVNTPALADVKITKKVNGLSLGETDNTDFNGKVEVSLDGGSNWGKYPLEYTIGDTGTTYTLTSAGELASNARLRNGRILKFANLPQGAKVRFTEENIDEEHSFVSVTGDDSGITVGASGNLITVTNQKLTPATQTITAKKTFDDQNYSGTLFKFGIKGLNIPDDPAANAKDTTIVSQETISVSNGTVTFNPLTFDSEGVYRYFVYEDTGYLAEKGSTYAQDITKTSSNFVATITVTKSSNKFIASNPVFTRTNKTSAAAITASDLSGASLTTATFTNVAQKGSLTINKTNQSKEKVGSVQFALYKLTAQQANSIKSMSSDADKYDAVLALDDSAKVSEQTTNTDGVAEFNDLDIYEANYTSSDQPGYQNYALIEIGGNADYHINKTPQIFKFPTYDTDEEVYQYHYTFDYVNGMIRNPYTAGNGMNALKLAGMFIVGMSLLALAGFVLYKKRNNKSFSKAKHYK